MAGMMRLMSNCDMGTGVGRVLLISERPEWASSLRLTGNYEEFDLFFLSQTLSQSNFNIHIQLVILLDSTPSESSS